MNFSFGIVTDYSNPQRLEESINSIRGLNIPHYEIVVVGGAIIIPTQQSDIRHIFFDDAKYPMWVTRKKNIAVKESRYDNVVLCHDYYTFDKDWYVKYKEFGDDWEICSNAQHLITGKRHFTDWVVWDSPIYPRYHSLDYNDWSHTQYMYISGGYFLVKKHVFDQQPFNEKLVWGQAEDVEWSLRVRDKYLIKCNGNSIVKHNKVHRDAL